jgi:hypothetical protein
MCGRTYRLDWSTDAAARSLGHAASSGRKPGSFTPAVNGVSATISGEHQLLTTSVGI